ncbi:MAG: AAA family ATPase [Butyrivibrio sp.]|nr:AAA family ATPase [Butyrivibrio sp.]
MELVYLYAGHLGKGIENTGINFSKNFEVTYDLANSRISIQRRKVTEERKKLFGKNIEDISVIVGKNGAGKSTIMRLLGLPDRLHQSYFGLFEGYSEDYNSFEGKHKWFAVYNLEGNTFLIEGYWAELLAGNLQTTDLELSPVYTIKFKYGFEKDLFYDAVSKETAVQPFYIYFSNISNLNWFDEYNPYSLLSYDLREAPKRLIRLVADRDRITPVFNYLCKAYNHAEFADRMGTKPGTTLKIKLHKDKYFAGFDIDDRLGETEKNDRHKFEEEAGEYIYHNKEIVSAHSYNYYLHKKPNELSFKEHFILAYMENEIVGRNFDIRFLGKELEKRYYSEIGSLKKCDELNYEVRKEYINKCFEIMRKYGIGDIGEPTLHIVEMLDAIPDKYFSKLYSIEIPMDEAKDSGVNVLIEQLDDRGSMGRIYSKEYLDLSFSDMSSGEAHFIDVFAAIQGAIEEFEKYYKKAYSLEGKQNCIILLDEPDMSFHPEWTRTFIRNLVDFLNEEDKDYNFQVIIATHSPLILSDIPSDSIFCLERVGKNDSADNKFEVRVTHPQYGMLSGLNDILIDSFFVDSLFGQLAEDYANGLIKRIEKWEKNLFLNSTAKAMEDKEYKELSEAINILGEGLVKASLKQRLERANGWYFIGDGPKNDQN